MTPQRNRIPASVEKTDRCVLPDFYIFTFDADSGSTGLYVFCNLFPKTDETDFK